LQSLTATFAHRVGFVGVSADSQPELADLAARLDFSLVADPDLTIIDRYRLRHEGGHPFTGGAISRPAVFLVDTAGVIRRRWLLPNWRVRVRPAQVLAALEELGVR
jgi:peroxiredoxin